MNFHMEKCGNKCAEPKKCAGANVRIQMCGNKCAEMCGNVRKQLQDSILSQFEQNILNLHSSMCDNKCAEPFKCAGENVLMQSTILEGHKEQFNHRNGKSEKSKK